MNILYIWDADYPWDVRVEKICMTLKENGHTVHIAARNLKKLHEYENINGLHIHRLKKWQNEKLNYALSFPAFFSPIWKRFLDSIIHNNRIDLIIVRDLPMAIAGIWSGNRHGISVIFDMAEDYVSMIWDIWREDKFRGLNLLVRNPYLASLVERYVFKNIDHILVVVEEAKAVVTKGGGNTDNVTIVGNTPLLASFNQIESSMNSTLQLIKDRFSVIYTGGIQMGRGIQTVLDSIPLVLREISDFLFVVVGDGYAVRDLKKETEMRGLENHVLWVGWIDHKHIYDYIHYSNIGVVPHFVTDHVNTTIPNKIFDYMGAGIPVLASNSKPMKRMVAEERCGLVFKSRNHEDLANKILSIRSSKINWGENGINLVKNKYNWNEDAKRLMKTIDKIQSKAKQNSIKTSIASL